jgi:hypothetical protein
VILADFPNTNCAAFAFPGVVKLRNAPFAAAGCAPVSGLSTFFGSSDGFTAPPPKIEVGGAAVVDDSSKNDGFGQSGSVAGGRAAGMPPTPVAPATHWY